MTDDPRSSRAVSALGPAVVAASAVAYFATAARHVLGGDNGELLAVAASGGVAHPPGYPLYVMYLRAMRWLPSVSPAHSAALATCFLGVASVWMMQRAARAWGASPAASAIASAVFAFSSLTWQLSTHAEVFALNALIALAIVTLSAPDVRARGATLAFTLGALAGLGIANHHSIVLLAPLGLYGVIRAIRTAKHGAVAAGLAAVGLALGLVPYAYVLLGSRTVTPEIGWAWGDAGTLRGLLDHFLRKEFGTTQLGIMSTSTDPLGQLWALARHLTADLLGLPVVAIAAGVALVMRRRRVAWSLVIFVVTIVIAGPAFVAIFNVPPRAVGARIVERFYLLPASLVCVIAARALDVLAPKLVAGVWAPWSVAGAVGLAGAGLALPVVREHHRPTVEIYAANALAMSPPNAILVGTGDHRFGAFLYARYAMHEREDVVFVNPRLLLGDWYPKQISALLGFEIVRGKDRVLSAAELTAQLLGTGRPVFFTDWFAPGTDRMAPSYPLGPLIRIVLDPADVPQPDALFAANEGVLTRFTLEREPPRRPDTWARSLQRDYERPWRVLAQAFTGLGRLDRAEECEQRALMLFPPADP